MRIKEIIIILIYTLKKTYLKEPYQNNTIDIIITKEQANFIKSNNLILLAYQLQTTKKIA